LKIAQLPFFVDDRGTQTTADVRRNVLRFEPDILFVDYLQKMTPEDEKLSREQQVSRMSAALKAIAKDFDIPVVSAAQLSRAVEKRDDKRPILSDLRDSGGVEQDADTVVMLYRDAYYNDDADPREIEFHIEKARHSTELRMTKQYLKKGAYWVVGSPYGE
jgi:replicative DNA helicase